MEGGTRLRRGRAAGQSARRFVQIAHLHLAEGAGAGAHLAQFVEGLLPYDRGGGDVHQEQQAGLAAPVGAQDGQDKTGLGGAFGGGLLVEGARDGAYGGAVALEGP